MHLNVAHNTAAFYSLLTIIVLDWMSIRLVMEFLVLTFYFFNGRSMRCNGKSLAEHYAYDTASVV